MGEADSFRTDRTPDSPLSTVVRRLSMYSVSSSACSSVGPLTGGEAAGGGGPSHAGLAWVARGGGRDRLPREGGARRGCDEGSLEASTGFDMAAVGLPWRGGCGGGCGNWPRPRARSRYRAVLAPKWQGVTADELEVGKTNETPVGKYRTKKQALATYFRSILTQTW